MAHWGKTSVKENPLPENQLWKQSEQKSKRNGSLSTILTLNGDTYTGDWLNDQKEGNGKYVWKNGEKYEGEWKNDKRHGKGIQYEPSEQGNELLLRYEGEWKNDFEDGVGNFFYRNGDVYKGEWKAGKKHGRGELVQKNGDSYVGGWYLDKHSESGIYTFANGNWYDGQWKNDLKEGEGTFYYLEARKKYEGVWKEGQAIKGALSPMEPGDLEGKDVKPPSKPPRELPQLHLLNPDKVLGK